MGRLDLSTFLVYPVVAVVLLGLTCGMVGSLVVANRMAFFSDAMAHTAFAGVGIALLGVVLAAGVRSAADADRYVWLIPLVMVGIGTVVGLGIGYVRERTGLTSDTVIGVFFALAVGVGSMLLPEVRRTVQVDTDQFLFGSVAVVDETDLVVLAGLAAVTFAVVFWRYNALVFVSFNPSLARSRGIDVRAINYLFILLLVLVVNLSIKAIGVLLINALLVVPAAAATNLGRNIREVFWLSTFGAVASGLGGLFLSRSVRVPLGGGPSLSFGPGGTIVVVCVGWFFATMLVSAARRRGGDRAG